LDQDEVSGGVLLSGPDGSVRLLDVDTATVERFEDTTGDIVSGAFSPDGRRLAVLTSSDGVQLYDVETGRRIGVPIDPDGIGLLTTPGITWSEDGTSVWVSPVGGPIRFAADPDDWREVACGVVHRELTAEEWRTFVSPDSEPVASCPGR
jgi:WD40 repeat protein